MCDPVSEPNEAAVCAAMVEGAREALAGYCSSIEEDLGLIRGGSLAPGSRQELAVQVGQGTGCHPVREFGGGGGSEDEVDKGVSRALKEERKHVSAGSRPLRGKEPALQRASNELGTPVNTLHFTLC